VSGVLIDRQIASARRRETVRPSVDRQQQFSLAGSDATRRWNVMGGGPNRTRVQSDSPVGSTGGEVCCPRWPIALFLSSVSWSCRHCLGLHHSLCLGAGIRALERESRLSNRHQIVPLADRVVHTVDSCSHKCEQLARSRYAATVDRTRGLLVASPIPP